MLDALNQAVSTLADAQAALSKTAAVIAQGQSVVSQGQAIAGVAQGAQAAVLSGQGAGLAMAAGVAISHVYEQHSDKVPAWLRAWVPTIAGIGGSVVTAAVTAPPGTATDWKSALSYGVLTTAASYINHALVFKQASAPAAPGA